MLKKIFFLNLLIIFTGFSTKIQTEAQEYDLKAAYVCHITKFIYWDSSIPGNEFIIGVLGASPIYEPIVEVAKTKTVNDKKIIIRQYTKVEELNNCNIIFIPKNTTIPLNEILNKAKSKNIVTISEHEGYCLLGTAVNFINVDNKLKFEVNIRTLESLGLKASAQFLKLAIMCY